MNRRERRWNAKPVVVSLLLHVAVVGLLAFSTGEAPPPPKTRVYAVDIVSPPPNMAGAPPTEALSNQEPGPAAAPSPAPAAETSPAPAPEPDPPAPDPEPAPPREAPKEPEKAPEPRRTPPQRPATQPAQRPSTTNTRPTASNTQPSTNNRPTTTPEKGRTTPTRPAGSSTTGGTGSGSTRTRGDGTSTAPATGSNPQAGSPGGEGINIHTEGDPCPVAGYCERVTLQVQRYFRPPAGNAGARGEVCFRIQRDGSVTDIEAGRLRGGGGAAFRLAMMEAAEAAGSRRAFGTLPSAFDPGRWRWCVELTPR
jgi:outer membrane biosynthesis protein TonB